jgi:hypothetical protein
VSDAIAIPSALDALEQRITVGADRQSLFEVLQLLQRLGLSQTDIEVHIERLRAVNDVSSESDVLEDASLLALEIVRGDSHLQRLRWDPAEVARLELRKVITREALQDAVVAAFRPSDLLPPRPGDNAREELRTMFVDFESTRLSQYQAQPYRADFFRAPKAVFTSRPAALLAPDDRLIYESLAVLLGDYLESALPTEVVWPRSRNAAASYDSFARQPLEWGTAYVVRTDIEAFYEHIDHALLATFLTSRIGAEISYSRATQAFLTTVMESSVGLPQGPTASEVFATAYLVPIDQLLRGYGVAFTRYADDYLFGATTVVDGRRQIQRLEAILREIGLHLNVSKTRIMRLKTYEAGLSGRTSDRVEAIRRRVREQAEHRLRQADDADEIQELLEGVGADEQLLFDLLYHQTKTVDEAIDEVRDLLTPSLTEGYARFFAGTTSRLSRERLPEDMLATERELSDALVVLAGARHPLDLEQLQAALRWFPSLAPKVVAYLGSIADERVGDVQSFLLARLDPLDDVDWVDAWLCSTAQTVPAIVNDALAKRFETIASSSFTGLLTRTAAVLALAAAGRLQEDVWRAVFAAVTPATRAELAFAVMANPGAYAWLPVEIRESTAALELLASDSRA